MWLLVRSRDSSGVGWQGGIADRDGVPWFGEGGPPDGVRRGPADRSPHASAVELRSCPHPGETTETVVSDPQGDGPVDRIRLGFEATRASTVGLPEHSGPPT